MDYSKIFPPKNPHTPSEFLFETTFMEETGRCNVIDTEDDLGADISKMPIEKRTHSMEVFRLIKSNVYRVNIKYRMTIPHSMDLVKDDKKGWVMEEFGLTSETVKQIGGIIDAHLSVTNLLNELKIF